MRHVLSGFDFNFEILFILEYVALSRDTTESDLKQRREIINGTAHYIDQSAVRAASEGRILILEGIEKAERNVLPVLVSKDFWETSHFS